MIFTNTIPLNLVLMQKQAPFYCPKLYILSILKMQTFNHNILADTQVEHFPIVSQCSCLYNSHIQVPGFSIERVMKYSVLPGHYTIFWF